MLTFFAKHLLLYAYKRYDPQESIMFDFRDQHDIILRFSTEMGVAKLSVLFKYDFNELAFFSSFQLFVP